MTGMENKGNGKGLGFFRRSKTPSSSSGGRATRSPSRDRHSGGPDHSGHATPQLPASQSKRPSPVRKAWSYITGPHTRMTAAKKVQPGIMFSFRRPDTLPEYSPRDEEEEEDDDDEEEAERGGAPDFGEDEPVEAPSEEEGDDTDGMHEEEEEEEEEDDGPDESVPMVVEHADRVSRAPEVMPEEEPRPYLEDLRRRELHEKHLRATREYPSEREMMREAIRRSHCQSYAPPPPLPPPAFYPSPPPHYQMYPPYPLFSPYQSYPQYPVYPPFFEPPRSPFAGPSSHDFPVDAPRRSSGTYIDPAELADIRDRADSMERERNRYRDLYHAATKEGKGKKKK